MSTSDSNRHAAFVSKQRAFSAHLRDPENHPAPEGLDPQRLEVYRNAVYANVEQFLADNFPRVKEIFSDSRWQTMVRDYIVRHVSNTAVFVELPLEFLTYLENIRDDDEDPEYLYELAHFEWLETLVAADQHVIDTNEIDRAGDLIEGMPVLNPVARLVKYTYPVHLIGANHMPAQAPAEPTYIVAYRKTDNSFAFLDLNAPAARLIELLGAARSSSGEQVLATVAGELGLSDPGDLRAAGVAMLQRLRDNEVILGTQPHQ